MWLSSSSVGRKFVMALSGAFLVLFVTFHCLMNSVAIVWPTAYNSICEFLGANWYALLASAVLAIFVIIHILYATVLTLQNRKARGTARYAVSKRPASVEWSSQNMYVLGIVIFAFLVVHLIQFWAKMQLQEIRGVHEVIPPAAGTLFLQEAFSLVWTPIVYIIGFIALWFHMNHGFWSMFQSIGWDSTVWIPRLKKIACWWSSIVVLLFIAQAIVFTVKANEHYYLTDPELRVQYKAMIAPMFEKDFGPGMVQGIEMTPYDDVSSHLQMQHRQMEGQMAIPEVQKQLEANPEMKLQVSGQLETLGRAAAFFEYIEQYDAPKAENPMMTPNM